MILHYSQSIQSYDKCASVDSSMCTNDNITQKHSLEVFYKKAVPKNYAIFTGKYQCWSCFLIKLKKRQVISCEGCEIFKNIYLEKRLRKAAFD